MANYKTVDGKKLSKDQFAWAPSDDPTTWKLPIDADHVEAAHRLVTHTQDIPDSEKAAVLARVRKAARAHGVIGKDDEPTDAQRDWAGLKKQQEQTMERCPQCGAEVDPDDEVCPECGAELPDPDEEDDVREAANGTRKLFCSRCGAGPYTVAAPKNEVDLQDPKDYDRSAPVPGAGAVRRVNSNDTTRPDNDGDAQGQPGTVARYCSSCGSPLTGQSAKVAAGQTGADQLERHLHAYIKKHNLALVEANSPEGSYVGPNSPGYAAYGQYDPAHGQDEEGQDQGNSRTLSYNPTPPKPLPKDTAIIGLRQAVQSCQHDSIGRGIPLTTPAIRQIAVAASNALDSVGDDLPEATASLQRVLDLVNDALRSGQPMELEDVSSVVDELKSTINTMQNDLQSEGLNWDKMRRIAGLAPLHESRPRRCRDFTARELRERQLAGCFSDAAPVKLGTLGEQELRQRRLAGLPEIRSSEGKKPLVEQRNGQVLQVLTESAVNGLMKVKGIVMQADQKNRNGRIYKRSTLEREVNRCNQRIAQGESLFASADHPADGIPSVHNACAVWNRFSMDDSGRVVGEATVLPNRAGRDVASVIKSGAKLGLSARGFGTTTPGVSESGERGDIVDDASYQLESVDFVIGPSEPSAVVGRWEARA